jgi:hypothetical protein
MKKFLALFVGAVLAFGALTATTSHAAEPAASSAAISADPLPQPESVLAPDAAANTAELAPASVPGPDQIGWKDYVCAAVSIMMIARLIVMWTPTVKDNKVFDLLVGLLKKVGLVIPDRK